MQQLPELATNEHYQCVFDDGDDGKQSHAEKVGDMLTCYTPEKRPEIPVGDGEYITHRIRFI